MAKGVINLQKESGGVTKITSTDGVTNTELVLPESGAVVSVDTAVTDNAIARYNGTTGKLENSNVIVDDRGNITAYNASSTDGGSEAFSIKYMEGQKPNVISSAKSSSAWSFGFGVKPSSTTAGKFISTVDNSSWKRGTLLVADTLTFLKAPAQNTAVGSTISMTEVFRTTSSGDLLLTSGTGALGYGTGAGGTVTQLTNKNFNVTLNKPTGTIITSDSALVPGQGTYFILLNSLISINDTLIITAKGSINYDIDVIDIYTEAAAIRIINRDSISRSDAISINFTVVKGATS